MQNSRTTNDSNRDQSIVERTVYHMFIAAVTLLALAVTVVYYIVPLEETVREVLFILDILFSPILLYDFIMQTYHAPNRVKYLVTIGWLDFVGALPGIPFLRFARIPGLWVGLRELRRSTAAETRLVARQQLAESSLLAVALLVLVVVSAGSILIVIIEGPVEGANIKTGSDAVWWSIVTVATVGYGDRYPVTNEGRVIGTITIFMGVGLFSVFTSYVATKFMARRKASGPSDSELLRKEMVAQFDALHRQTAEEKAENAALRAELAQLHAAIAELATSQRPDATR